MDVRLRHATDMAQVLMRTGCFTDDDAITVEQEHASNGMLSAWGVLWDRLPAEHRTRAVSYRNSVYRHADMHDPPAVREWNDLDPYHQMLFAVVLSCYLT